MSHTRRLGRLLVAGVLLAPAIAVPLVVGTTGAASADGSTCVNADGSARKTEHDLIYETDDYWLDRAISPKVRLNQRG